MRRLLAAWLAMGSLQCSVDEVPYTQVTVHVRFVRTAVEVGDQLRIRVWRGRYGTLVRDCLVDASELFGASDVIELEVPVVPDDNSTPTEMTFVATLHRSNGTPLATQRAIVEYVKDAIVGVDLPFAAGCGDTPCSDYETCSDASCVSACFNRTAEGTVERGPCEPRGGPFESCDRMASHVIGNESQSESWCPFDGTCFCRDPEGCIPEGAAACCKTGLVCDPPNNVCLSAATVGDPPRCTRDFVRCPDEDRCVEAGLVDECCGGGISSCFGL